VDSLIGKTNYNQEKVGFIGRKLRDDKQKKKK
jgi:hypothetical protein